MAADQGPRRQARVPARVRASCHGAWRASWRWFGLRPGRPKLRAFGAILRERELDIVRERLLNDAPATLQEIGEKYGISRERARQIEERLKKKLRRFLESELGDAVDVSSAE